jgi:FkbM family methyltransferase
VSDNIIYDIEVYPYNELVSTQVRGRVMEPDELVFLRNLLKLNDVVIDCGANIGLHSINFADVVGNNGRIYSFEPILQNFMLLCKNIVNRSFSEIIVPVNASLGKSPGAEKFYLNPKNMGDCRPSDFWLESNATAIVPRITLDEYFSLLPDDVWTRMSLIKMETQGSEIGILQGGEGLFKKHSDIPIFMEYWPYGLSRNNQDVGWFFSFLENFNFNIFDTSETQPDWLSKKRTRVGGQITLEEVKSFYFDYVDIDFHINLFLTKGSLS